MSNGHGSSRRQTYGRRMKDLRTRRASDMRVDLDGPNDWSRGAGWDDDRPMPRRDHEVDQGSRSARPR